MTQLATSITPIQPLKSRPLVAWMGHSADTSRADARAAFYVKFGYTAAKVQITGGGVLAGPIREGESDE